MKGLTLIEVLVTVTLFSLVTLSTFLLLSRGHQFWRDSSGHHTATLKLNAAKRLSLELDESTNPVGIADVPSSLSGGAPDGKAVWFLSARDSATGEFVRGPDGAPFWQRNVLYYLVVPQQHATLFGSVCAGGPGPGPDDYCPHKVLVRKVIDSGPPTVPSGDIATTVEELLPDVAAYLTRPDGYEVNNMAGESGLEQARLVATQLLYFDAVESSGEVILDLRATSIPSVSRRMTVGSGPLGEDGLTSQSLRSVFPRN